MTKRAGQPSAVGGAVNVPAPRRFRIEHVLIVCGVSSAVASSSFAAFMITHNTGRPDVHAGEYFSVFAQIDRQQRARAAARVAEREAQSQAGGLDPDVDPIVTGSIAPARKPRPHSMPLAGFSLREVFDGTALVDSPTGLQVAHPGATLVGAGRVIAIEKRGGRMVVVTERGIVQGEPE